MVPVLVCVPGNFGLFGVDDPTHMLMAGPLVSTPVGYLQGFETDQIMDNEMVAGELSELSPVGLEMRYFISKVVGEKDARAAIVAFAVEVPTFEAAASLPGFRPLGDVVGPYRVGGSEE